MKPARYFRYKLEAYGGVIHPSLRVTLKMTYLSHSCAQSFPCTHSQLCSWTGPAAGRIKHVTRAPLQPAAARWILENRAIIQLATLGKVEAGIFRRMQLFRSCSLCRSCSEKGDFILADNIYLLLSFPLPVIDCLCGLHTAWEEVGMTWEWGCNSFVWDQRTLPSVHMEQSAPTIFLSGISRSIDPHLRWSLVYGREWNTWKTQNSYSVRKPLLQWLLSTKCIPVDRAQQTLHAGTRTAGLVLQTELTIPVSAPSFVKFG